MKAGNKVVKWGMMQIRIPDAVCCFPLFVQQSVPLTNWTCHLRWKLNQLKECFARNLRMYFLPNHYNTVSSCVYGDLTIAPKNVLHANCWNFKSLKPAPVATICRKVLGFGRGTFVRRGIRHQACWHNLASIWSTRLWPPHLIVQSHIFFNTASFSRRTSFLSRISVWWDYEDCGDVEDDEDIGDEMKSRSGAGSTHSSSATSPHAFYFSPSSQEEYFFKTQFFCHCVFPCQFQAKCPPPSLTWSIKFLIRRHRWVGNRYVGR